jgi:hypothetical protein
MNAAESAWKNGASWAVGSRQSPVCGGNSPLFMEPEVPQPLKPTTGPGELSPQPYVDSSVGTVTTIRAGRRRIVFRLLAVTRDLSALRNVQTRRWDHKDAYSMRHSGRDVKLTTHLHLVPRLRMGGAMPLLPPIYLHAVQRDSFAFNFHSHSILYYCPIYAYFPWGFLSWRISTKLRLSPCVLYSPPI